MLAPERWARVRDLLERAVDLPPHLRSSYLSDACPDDSAIRSEVSSLLEAHDAAGTFLDGPPSPWSDSSDEVAGEVTLSAGSRLGHFEIVEKLGAGGMGRVYKATDTRLDRTVAIKLIAPALADDPKHRERFEREARAISRLAHPNICVLHDVGLAVVGRVERRFLVMELVEGETLSARLARGALPIESALDVARQIADALAAAHRQGIVHRDLKPANVMLTRRGVKLLDFGLATLNDLAQSRSLDDPGAGGGENVIAGTLPYMSPEQLRGASVDARADVFALGAVLYEMLSGRRAFAGETRADLVAAILESDPPDVGTLQPQAPPALARLVHTCLAKDPADRWQSPHDVALQLQEIGQHLAAPARADHRRPRALTLAGATAALVGALGGAFWLVAGTTHNSPAEPTRRLVLETAPGLGGQAWSPTISPDGRSVAVLAGREGGDRFVITDFGTGRSRELSVRDWGCGWGFAWSDDGRSLIFSGGAFLRSIDVTTGAIRTLGRWGEGPATLKGGVAQSDSGQILMGGTRLLAWSSEATGLRPLAEPHSSVTAQLWPSFLRGGREFVFTQAATDPGQVGIFLGSIDSPQTVRLSPVFSNAQVSTSGHLVYGREGSLLAQTLDLGRRALTGEPLVIATGLGPSGDYVHFSLSADGTLVYAPQHPGTDSQLVLLDRSGSLLQRIGRPSPYRQMALDARADRLVIEMDGFSGEGSNIWLMDPARGTTVRANPALSGGDVDPVWSPDGQRLAFTAWRDSDADLFVVTPDSPDPPVRLAALPGMQWAQQWTADGRWILYVQTESSTTRTSQSLWALPVDGGPPVPLVRSPVTNLRPQLSSDNRWLAYVSDEGGYQDVYLQRWGEPGQRWKVSTNGGGQPKWRADGRELFYVALDGTMMMSVAVPRDGLPGEPRPLFKAPLEPDPGLNKYAVTPDGHRFFVISPIESTESARLTVVSNWPGLLRK